MVCIESRLTSHSKVHTYSKEIQNRFSRKQSHKLKKFIPYIRLIFSCTITPSRLHRQYWDTLYNWYSSLCNNNFLTIQTAFYTYTFILFWNVD